MGVLRNLINKKQKKEIIQDVSEPIRLNKYNHMWLNNVSDAHGYIISDNKDKVNGILSALNRKDGHCPCGGSGIQFLCPCHIMREKGICKCGLFQNITPVEPKGSSDGRISEK